MKTKKDQVFLQLGSNMGDRVYYLNQAKRYIAEEIGSIVSESRVYESALCGALGIQSGSVEADQFGLYEPFDDHNTTLASTNGKWGRNSFRRARCISC